MLGAPPWELLLSAGDTAHAAVSCLRLLRVAKLLRYWAFSIRFGDTKHDNERRITSLFVLLLLACHLRRGGVGSAASSGAAERAQPALMPRHSRFSAALHNGGATWLPSRGGVMAARPAPRGVARSHVARPLSPRRLACCWRCVAAPRFAPDVLAARLSVPASSLALEYTHALYVSMLFVFGDDCVPTTAAEHGFATFALFTGGVLVSGSSGGPATGCWLERPIAGPRLLYAMRARATGRWPSLATGADACCSPAALA